MARLRIRLLPRPRGRAASSLEQQYEQVVARVLPSVVQISTSSGSGSGVVYDTRGDIVTNAHVVVTATALQVSPASGGQTSAAINPGNSGGALVNLAGQVIGNPTLAATSPQLGGAAAAIGSRSRPTRSPASPAS